MPFFPGAHDFMIHNPRMLDTTGSTLAPDSQQAEGRASTAAQLTLTSDVPQAQGQAPIKSPVIPSEEESHWETCLEYAEKRIKQDVDTYKDEVVIFLLFATLLALVVSPFAVESYHKVAEDPADTTVFLLRTLVALQLNATNPQPSLPINLDNPVPISAAARRVNIYNFLSLILSLIVVVVGILCLQWLREYNQDLRKAAASRWEQLELCRMQSDGMEKWHVFEIIKLLPVILVLALFVFFVGIIESLLQVDSNATIVASVMIFLVFFFSLFTTISPTLQIIVPQLPWRIKLPHCPYKSPQAWTIYRMVASVINSVMSTLPRRQGSSNTFRSVRNWTQYEWWLYKNLPRSNPRHFNEASPVHWLGGMYLHEERFAKALPEALWESAMWDRRYIPSLRETLPPRWKEPLQNAIDWGQTRIGDLAEAHLCDVAVFQALACLVEENKGHQASPVLLRKRWELFVRICETRVDADIECPLLRKIDDDTVIPRDLRKRALECLFKAMQSTRRSTSQSASQSDWESPPQYTQEGAHRANKTYLKAVGEILRIELQAPRPRLELFHQTQAELKLWTTSGLGIHPGDSAMAQTVLKRIEDLEQLVHSGQSGRKGD